MEEISATHLKLIAQIVLTTFFFFFFYLRVQLLGNISLYVMMIDVVALDFNFKNQFKKQKSEFYEYWSKIWM